MIKQLFLALCVITVSATCAVAQFDAQQTYCAGPCVGGTGNAIVLNIPNIVTASDLVGVPLRFKVASANSGQTTVSVPPTAAAPLMKFTSTGLAPLIGGELPVGPVVDIIFDGTEYVIPGLQPPTALVAPLNYYVNASTGSDSNSGLTPTTAFATIQRGIMAAQSVNTNGFIVTIIVADGTYAPIQLGPINGSGGVNIVGDVATPANAKISASVGPAVLAGYTGYEISGFQLSSGGNNASIVGACVYATGAATLIIYDISFGQCFFADILAQFGASVSVLGAVEGLSGAYIDIAGPTLYFAYALNGGSIGLGQPVLNISASYTQNQFASAIDGNISGMFSSIVNPSSTITGAKFIATFNGVINTGTSNNSYFPGTSPGFLATGGQYN